MHSFLLHCVYTQTYDGALLFSIRTRKRVYFINVARESLTSVWRLLFFTDNCTCPWHDPHVYVLEHVQLKQPDQGHHILFISNGACLQIAARANVFWLFIFFSSSAPMYYCSLGCVFKVGRVILIYLQPCCVD